MTAARITVADYTLAPYMGSDWGMSWDFAESAQNWQSSADADGAAEWRSNYGGSMCFESGDAPCQATLDVTALPAPFNQIGAPATGDRRGFMLQCDILIPAYTGLGSVGGAHPGVLQGMAIGAARVGGLGPCIGGGTGSQYGARANDRTWDGTTRTLSRTFGEAGVIHTETWMTLQLEYGYHDPLKWNAWVRSPLPNDADPTFTDGWMQVAAGRPTNLNGDAYVQLVIGASGMNSVSPWGDCYIDNVRLRVVPEPGALALSAVIWMCLVLGRRTLPISAPHA